MKVFFRISVRQKEREALSGQEFHWPIRKDAGHQCKSTLFIGWIRAASKVVHVVIESFDTDTKPRRTRRWRRNYVGSNCRQDLTSSFGFIGEKKKERKKKRKEGEKRCRRGTNEIAAFVKRREPDVKTIAKNLRGIQDPWSSITMGQLEFFCNWTY